MNRLYAFLEQYARPGEGADAEAERKRTEARIWADFGVEQTVFVLDMAGFSRLVQRHGLVHYLSMVHRMRLAVAPVVREHEGHVVKFEADNCFARFPSPTRAIEAAIAVNRAAAGINADMPTDSQIHVAIGIDAGRFLLIENDNLFGDPVNLASKLGEDIAKAGEILVTDRAFAQAGNPRFNSERLSLHVSGVRIVAHRISY